MKTNSQRPPICLNWRFFAPALVWALCVAQPTAAAEPPAPYGADEDRGETDDPRVDPVRYAGQVYYVGCTRGDDGNDGRTPETAWKTLSAVNERTEVGYWDLPTSNGRGRPAGRGPRVSAPSGSAFLFERGCVFDGYINVHAIGTGTPRAGYSEDITFGAYGERSKPRPRIETSAPQADFRAVIWSNGHQIHVRNLHLAGNSAENKAGVWLRQSRGSSVENTLIENMGGDGVHAGESQDLLIRNSVFRNNQLVGRPGGGVTGSGSNLRLLHNTFIGNGRHRILAHNVYLSALDNAVIQGNRIEGGSNLGIVLHGACTGVQIVGNDIFGNSNGIDISGGYPNKVESFDRLLIERNRIHHNGLAPNQQGYGLLLKSLVNSVVRNNLVYANRVSPLSVLDKNEGDPASSNVVIEHNVFQSPSLGLLFGGAELSGIVLRNNIVAVMGNDGFAVSKTANTPDTALTLDSDLYFAPRLDSRKLVRWGTQLYPLAEFASTFQQERHAVNADPLFVNAAAGDFRLQNRSPARHAGLPASAPAADFQGAPRASTPSMGAFE